MEIALNSQFTNFLSNKDKNITIMYKGFYVVRDYAEPTFKVLSKLRKIIYNPDFFNRLTEAQIFFCLEWAIRQYQSRDVNHSYRVTYNYCITLGIDKNDINDFIKTLTHYKKLSENDYNLSFFEKTSLFWTRFFNFFRNLFK